MDSNDRERVEEARAELKKMVNLFIKKKKMKLIQLHNILMSISNGHYNLTKGGCIIVLGAVP